jgi:hypothetical protein
MAVTWDFPRPDFAALVVYASEDHLRVWIYNFGPRTERVGMRLWQLRPGEYEVNRGLIGAGDGLKRNYRWQPTTSFVLRHRADVFRLEVPSRRELAVDLRLQEAIDRSPVLSDPAIADRDVRMTKTSDGKLEVTATVHNLGNVPVQDLTVDLVVNGEGRRGGIVRQRIGLLPACKELRAGTAEVSFRAVKPAARISVVLDADDAVSEICEQNNRGTWQRETSE